MPQSPQVVTMQILRLCTVETVYRVVETYPISGFTL